MIFVFTQSLLYNKSIAITQQKINSFIGTLGKLEGYEKDCILACVNTYSCILENLLIFEKVFNAVSEHFSNKSSILFNKLDKKLVRRLSLELSKQKNLVKTYVSSLELVTVNSVISCAILEAFIPKIDLSLKSTQTKGDYVIK